ncbi:MAG TPA: universal stress protein [Candidatus Sulfotelmatobacter sp.]
MFTKIVIALNDLPESQRALRTAIELARACNAELATVFILGDLPAHTSFAIVVDPNAPNELKEDRRRAYSELHEKAALLAQGHGVRAKGSIVEGRQVQAILHFLKKMSVPICLLLAFISTTSIYPVFGVRFMTSLRKLPAVCSRALSAPVKSSEVFQSKWGSLGGFTA